MTQYLKRTPSSTGNRTTWTFSAWVKHSAVERMVIFGSRNDSSAPYTLIRTSSSTINWEFSLDAGTDGSFEGVKKDVASWSNLVVSINTTLEDDADRIRYYVNGKKLNYSSTQASVTKNTELDVNDIRQHVFGVNPGYSQYWKGEILDAFLVDGQALTPDVFGFYKDGDGYMSSGTTQATDFKPGQWVPKSPSVIKNVINNSGGFGVNGFYLPMNDSSNPGADFHCDPNSIITLRGEDLPQPRNGAPTTSDAYVSQLRSDPYSANLVLAVPGISTSTSATLITNGTFDSSDLSDWTTTDNTQSWNNGQLQINRSGGGGATSYQAFTTEAGKRYTVKGTVNSSGSRGDLRIYDGTGFGGTLLLNFSGTSGQTTTQTGSFTASSTTSTLGFSVDNNSTTIYVDNVVVKQEDTPRDYSADIKGSGTNKTLTPVGNAGVGYELGGYYGSTMTFPGTYNHNIPLGANTDFAFGTGDFTVEMWFYTNQTARQRILSSTQGGFVSTTWVVRIEPTNTLAFYSNNTISSSVVAAANQWHHVAVTREGLLTSLYLNGVCIGIDTNDNKNYTEAGSNNFWLSSGYTVDSATENFDGYIQDLRIYKGVAKYKGSFDVPKPYTPVGIESWRTTVDTCKNTFATLNPLTQLDNNQITYSNGNLTAYVNPNTNSTISTLAMGSQKYYAEFIFTDNTYPRLGVIDSTVASKGTNGSGTGTGANNLMADGVISWGGNSTEVFINSTTNSGTGTGYGTGDIIGVAYDGNTRNVWFSKNNVWQNFTGSGADPANGTNPVGTLGGSDVVHFAVRPEQSTVNSNFGQNPSFSGLLTAGTNADDSGKGLFKYAPPTGFLALCEDNLPAPAIADPGEHFKTVLWTGDGQQGRSITGVGFKPDFVWIGNRDRSTYKPVYDSVRGATNMIRSNTTSAEESFSTVLNSFDADGFTVGTDSAHNASGEGIVAWCWKAGGAAVSNTDGSITSQVSVNQDAGFSIVKVDSLPASTTSTFGHGLNKKPDFIIFKSRNNATNWDVYHSSLTPDGERKVYLNSTSGEIDSGFMGDTPPTSSVISFNPGSSISNHIVYCWTEIEGFSKFGSYAGNGSADGTFVYCGFKPAWILIKETGGTGNWLLWDSSRKSINPTANVLVPNSTIVEYVDETTLFLDMLSNGFKARATSDDYNGSGGTYIYMAFAESPFQTANAK